MAVDSLSLLISTASILLQPVPLTQPNTIKQGATTQAPKAMAVAEDRLRPLRRNSSDRWTEVDFP